MAVVTDSLGQGLHPDEQRRLLPALLSIPSLLAARPPNLQVIASTWSPLVLASAEPCFDAATDRLFKLTDSGHLKLVTWDPRGTVDNWLTSDVIGLTEPRSIDAERAIVDARLALRNSDPDLSSVMITDDALRQALPSHDKFWVRWSHYVDNLKTTNSDRDHVLQDLD